MGRKGGRAEGVGESMHNTLEFGVPTLLQAQGSTNETGHHGIHANINTSS